MVAALTIEQGNMIADAVEERQTRFPDEPLRHSVLVVLFNIADRFARVACVRGDWLGDKHEAVSEPGQIPHCPKCGGVLVQTASPVVLGFGPVT